MKAFYLMVILLALILSSCTSSLGPTNTPSTSDDPRLESLKKYAADKLSLEKSEIIFVSMVMQEWPDACLGLPQKEEMCAMVLTPGYLVIFNSPQGTLEFHTNEDLSYFRMAPVGTAITSVTWQRSGGIAGICEELKILFDNTYLLTECSGNIISQGKLADTDAAELTALIKRYSVTDWFSKQPQGSADMFNDHFILYGMGEETANDNQSEQLNEWLAGLTGRLKQQNPQSISTENSGIEGLVTIGPTCPGPTRIGDTECADKPFQTWISILDEAGNTVARGQSDESGHYKFFLPAGKYILVPESANALPYAEQQAVEVTSGSFASIDIQYDSGIR